MMQWLMDFWVDLSRGGGEHPEADGNAMLRAVSRIEPRPVKSLYHQKCIRWAFIVDAENRAEAHAMQRRVYDSLFKAIEEAPLGSRGYALEFDTPQVVEAGSKVL